MFLSFSFRRLCLRMRSALRRLERLFLSSSHSGFRPCLSSWLAFLACFRSQRRFHANCSISLSFLAFCLGPALHLAATTPNQLLHSSYMRSPKKLSLVSTGPRRECSSMNMMSFCQTATSLAFGHLIVCLCPGSFFSLLWIGS